jgi:hypothetical protein
MQEGDDPRYIKVIGTCKHFWGYDVDCAPQQPDAVPAPSRASCPRLYH